MKRLTLAVFFIVTALAFNALALEVPPRPLGRVSDYTNTLSNRQIRGLDEMLEQYYRIRGWSQDGLPTEEKLKDLGLDGM